MAEPACRNAEGPGAREWAAADIRQLIAVTLQAVPQAYAGWLASGCDDTSPAAAMLELVTGVLRHLDDTVRAADVGEEVIGELIARAVAEDRAGWPRRRGYPLRAVPG